MEVLMGNPHRKLPEQGDIQQMGRWAYTMISVSNQNTTRSKRLHISFIYRENAGDLGDSWTLNQQRGILVDQVRYKSPQYAFSKDLEQQLASYHSEGDALILAGDFNCSLEDPLMKKSTNQFLLNHMMLSRSGATQPTRDLGTRTINHIFVSTMVVNLIENTEYLPFWYGMNSAHRALVIDIKSEDIWGDKPTPSTGHQRKLDSRQCTNVREYKAQMTK